MAAQDQIPTGSGFGAKSTAMEVIAGIDLSGRYAIVTGGYSGIGLETVRALASAGATVTVPARRVDAAQAALGQMAGQIEIAAMDLADISSIRRFGDDYVAAGRGLDLLINNAGIMACPQTRVGPGWEAQFAVNQLGHFELYRRLLPALRKAGSGRLVALSSTAHILTDIHWQDPHFEAHDYDKWQAYGQSKTADALFALGVDMRMKDEGFRAFSVHPGGIFTDLQRHLPDEEMAALGWKNADGTIPDRIREMFKTPQQGASTTIWAATSPQLDGRGGVYCEDCDIAQLAGTQSQRYEHVREWACNEESADRLWKMSEAMLAEV